MFRLGDLVSTAGHHLANVAWFISIVSCCGHAILLYTPCNYPIPGSSAFLERCSSYLNLDYLCDIDGVMTKTDADQIHLTISKYDLYKKYPETRVGIATMQSVHLPATFPRMKNNNKNIYSLNPDWNCTSNISSNQLADVLKWRNGTSASHYIQWFADTLSTRWFRSDCVSTILFFSVTLYVADWDNRKLLQSPPVHISMGTQLRTQLGENYYHQIQRDLVLWHNEGTSPVLCMKKVLDQVAQKIAEFNGKKPKPDYDIPFWAIYAFMTCFAVLAIALLLDCLIVRQKTLSLRGGGSSGSGSHGGGAAKPKSESTQVHLYF